MTTGTIAPAVGSMLAQLRDGQVVDATPIYIDGQWVASASDGRLEVFSRSSGEVMAHVADGSPDDAQEAVTAARAALTGWAATPADERADYLQKVGDLLAERLEGFGELQVDMVLFTGST